MDPYSLYLSLKDDDDERVQSSLREMMENYLGLQRMRVNISSNVYDVGKTDQQEFYEGEL